MGLLFSGPSGISVHFLAWFKRPLNFTAFDGQYVLCDKAPILAVISLASLHPTITYITLLPMKSEKPCSRLTALIHEASTQLRADLSQWSQLSAIVQKARLDSTACDILLDEVQLRSEVLCDQAEDFENNHPIETRLRAYKQIYKFASRAIIDGPVFEGESLDTPGRRIAFRYDAKEMMECFDLTPEVPSSVRAHGQRLNEERFAGNQGQTPTVSASNLIERSCAMSYIRSDS